VLALTGCSELVGLGTECPEGTSFCIVELDGGFSQPRLDAQSILPPPVDAAPHTTMTLDGDVVVTIEPDGASSVSPLVAAFPVVRNGTFALTNGSPGDFTTVSSTDLAPWHACQAIGLGDNPTTAMRVESSVSLSASETPANTVITARDGSATFMSMQYLVKLVNIPLTQTLSEPLQPGAHYAFALDVLSTHPDYKLSLRVRGSSNDDACLDTGELLVEGDPITAPGWQTICLPFTANAEHTSLGLSLKSDALLAGALMNGVARLFIDNLRPATAAECPGLQ
jgi:hypothetical protein